MLTSRPVFRYLQGSTVAPVPPSPDLHKRVRAAAAAAGVIPAETDVALEGELTTLLRADVPGFIGLVQVQPETSKVVYEATPTGTTSFYQRSYSGDPGRRALGPAQAVQPVTTYTPTGAPAPPSRAAHAATNGIPATPSLHERVRAAARVRSAAPAGVGVTRHMTRTLTPGPLQANGIPESPSLHERVRAAAKARGAA